MVVRPLISGTFKTEGLATAQYLLVSGLPPSPPSRLLIPRRTAALEVVSPVTELRCQDSFVAVHRMHDAATSTFEVCYTFDSKALG
jgi:hypothetical protein